MRPAKVVTEAKTDALAPDERMPIRARAGSGDPVPVSPAPGGLKGIQVKKNRLCLSAEKLKLIKLLVSALQPTAHLIDAISRLIHS